MGDNVVVGAGAIILGGVKIGNNCRVAAGAIVLDDIPDNTVYVCKIDPKIYEAVGSSGDDSLG